MRLVFAGTPEVAAVALRAVLASRHDVVAVLTRPDAAAGRGRRETRSPVAVIADEVGLPVLQPASARDAELEQQLRALQPQCIPVVAYGALVPTTLLDLPPHGWINTHFSLLPAWRGAAPVQHALRAGDAVTGVTVFRLDAGMDTGPVLAQVREPIRADDTSGSLLARLAILGADLLVRTLDALEDGTAHAEPQSGVASLAPKVSVDDARIDWTQPADVVDRLIRSCTPEPGAWTMLGADRLRLGPVSAGSDVSDVPVLTPGDLLVRKNSVLVGTGTHPLVLGEVQGPGRRAMAAADWARGARPAADAVLR